MHAAIAVVAAVARATVPLPFRHVTLVDFEFGGGDGEAPRPVCLVAHELRSGRTHRVWEDELRRLRVPPYPTGSDSLLVAYYASAEVGCHLALGWPLPANVLDLHAEFRNLTNGLPLTCGASLLGALAHFGLSSIDVVDKDAMRQLALRGGPWTEEERAALLDYCATDVEALQRLLPVMQPSLDVPRALLRGRYMRAAAVIEANGIPIDTDNLRRLRDSWPRIQDQLISQINDEYDVFDGRTFKVEKWERWLVKNGIGWPRLPSGALALDDDTFREMARLHPRVSPIRELRHSLSQLRLNDLAVGHDARGRCLLSAFRARTGRNQPSNTKFIFGPSVWLRALIAPPPGQAVAYIDWSQQEFGIAAALSHDMAMLTAYESGDPYLTFAKQAGAVPADATKTTHASTRERFKACALAVQYGMGADALASRIGQCVAEARALLDMHRRTYATFWRWSDAALDYATLYGSLGTVFGWNLHTVAETNPRSIRNYPMQANGAEMLRLACCFAVERGIKLCAPVHDALLIEAPIDSIDEAVLSTQAAMAEASEIVLDGFRLRSDAKVVRYPERYMDPRGERMWSLVSDILGGAPVQQLPCTDAPPSDLLSVSSGEP